MDTNPTVPEAHFRRRLSYALFAAGCILLILAGLVGISDNPPGIVSLLLGGFLIILAIFFFFGKLGNLTLGLELLYWSPRALTIMIALFTSVFAFDVFDEAHGFWETAGALFMHLIPVWLMLIFLWISWRWEWIGGVVYCAMAVLYVVTMWERHFPWVTYALIAGPLALMGILFLLNWKYRDKLRGGPGKGATPTWLVPIIMVVGFATITILYFASIPTLERVTFRIDAPEARQVFVAGSFNGWRPLPMGMDPQGHWETTVSVPLGRHEYKFKVDSIWVHDENNPNKVQLSPPLHGFNSVIVVGKKDSSASNQ